MRKKVKEILSVAQKTEGKRLPFGLLIMDLLFCFFDISVRLFLFRFLEVMFIDCRDPPEAQAFRRQILPGVQASLRQIPPEIPVFPH